MSTRIINADVFEGLAMLPDESVNCAVTSPPYLWLRSYLRDDDPRKHLELGQEPTLDVYITSMVRVFNEVRRVLRRDGTLWLNLGDAYAGSWGAQSRGDDYPGTLAYPSKRSLSGRQISEAQRRKSGTGSTKRTPGLKPKDLMMIPARVAIALQENGWWLRSEIIWHKTNGLPESVTDRPTMAHEKVFLLSKSRRYWYDAEAVREEAVTGYNGSSFTTGKTIAAQEAIAPVSRRARRNTGKDAGRNMRNVWAVPTAPFSEAHFAVMPPEIARRCVLAGCPKGGTVLDPFGGAGTTALVADRLDRNAILIELNAEYCEMARRRISQDAPLFADVSVECAPAQGREVA